MSKSNWRRPSELKHTKRVSVFVAYLQHAFSSLRVCLAEITSKNPLPWHSVAGQLALVTRVAQGLWKAGLAEGGQL